ncbi:hypothetical protein BH18VER1_BH18VER1_08960 [soil metagenome]
MPATFAHPAAILPLRRYCGRWLEFTALIIGSVTPDFGYYVRRFDVASFAHSPAGTVLFCLPWGLVAYALFRLLRAPLCFLLPQPHRGALTPLVTTQLALTLQKLGAIAVSVVFGAWTHIIADSSTHKTGWIVQRIPVLQEIVFRIGGADFPVHQLLQHAGSTLGTALLIGSYVPWLRRQRRAAPESTERLSDHTRMSVLAVLATIAIAAAIPLARHATAEFAGYFGLRVFAFQAAIYAVQVFVPLLMVTAVVLYRSTSSRRV